MNKGIAIVIRNLQGRILLVKDIDGKWTIPYQTNITTNVHSRLYDLVKFMADIKLKSFSKCNDYLCDEETVYTVYSTIVDESVGSFIEHVWIDEFNIPDNVGELTKYQLRKELVFNAMNIEERDKVWS